MLRVQEEKLALVKELLGHVRIGQSPAMRGIKRTFRWRGHSMRRPVSEFEIEQRGCGVCFRRVTIEFLQ